MIGKIKKGRSFGGDTEHAVHRGEASRDGQPALPHRLQPGGL